MEITLTHQFIALALLLALSGFFSMSETSMMAANRMRLKSQAKAGSRGARLALDLLRNTDSLLSVVLIFNNLINVGVATLSSVITIQLFQDNEWALLISTLLITLAILIFSEITPKIIGANYADRIAIVVSYALATLLRFWPVKWLVTALNLVVSGALTLIGLRSGGGDTHQKLSTEELRALVLEHSHFMPHKNTSILHNLFSLDDIFVEDILTPRSEIEALDISAPIKQIREQLITSHHTRIPVYDDDLDNMLGILHLRRITGDDFQSDSFNADALRAKLSEVYYIPSNTPVYSQLQFFQENKQRLGIVVDEYGEILGLLTLDDIIEEIVGKFTTSQPNQMDHLHWDDDRTAIVDGKIALRELNRRLSLNLPVDGPKTVNGLVIEALEEIPDADVSIRIAGVVFEVIQTQDRMVKTARIFQPHNLKNH